MEMEMRFYHKLYVGMRAQEHKRRIIRNAKHRRLQPEVYFITLPVNEKNNMEIYPSWVLLQSYYRKKDIFVIGVGIGKGEVTQMVEEIIMDCYRNTGQFQVRDYILNEK